MKFEGFNTSQEDNIKIKPNKEYESIGDGKVILKPFTINIKDSKYDHSFEDEQGFAIDNKVKDIKYIKQYTLGKDEPIPQKSDWETTITIPKGVKINSLTLNLKNTTKPYVEWKEKDGSEKQEVLFQVDDGNSPNGSANFKDGKIKLEREEVERINNQSDKGSVLTIKYSTEADVDLSEVQYMDQEVSAEVSFNGSINGEELTEEDTITIHPAKYNYARITKEHSTNITITKFYYDLDSYLEYGHNSQPEGHLLKDADGNIVDEDGNKLFNKEDSGYKATEDGKKLGLEDSYSSEEALLEAIIKKGLSDKFGILEYIENNDIKYGHVDSEGNIVGIGSDKESTDINVEGNEFLGSNISQYFKGAHRLAGAIFEVRDLDGKLIKTTAPTNEKGEVAFALPDGKYIINEVSNPDKDAYYYLEDAKKVKVENAFRYKAVPIHLDLPIFNNKEGILDEIHLYPKNIENVPTIKKTLVDASGRPALKNNFSIGEDIRWEIETIIPRQLELDSLRILDIPSLGVTMDELENIEAIKIEGEEILTVENDYKIIKRSELEDFEKIILNESNKIGKIKTNEEETVELPDWYKDSYKLGIEFRTDVPKGEKESGLDKINRILSQTEKENIKIKFIVKGRLNGDHLDNYDLKEDEAELRAANLAVVEYNKNANLDENIVETGGRQFVKLNVLKEKLEGAEFVIYRNGFKTVDQKQEKIKEYLVVNPTNKFMTWTEDENKASVFESLGGEEDVQTGEKINRKGLGIITLKGHEDINLKGLRYGTYYIEEIKAPEGYAKLTNPKEFIVACLMPSLRAGR